VADPAAHDNAVELITAGFDTIALPPEASEGTASRADAERRDMARLAETLYQHNLLNPSAFARLRR
jgi:hypothetical protein